jgi:hypothetical protein
MIYNFDNLHLLISILSVILLLLKVTFILSFNNSILILLNYSPYFLTLYDIIENKWSIFCYFLTYI